MDKKEIRNNILKIRNNILESEKKILDSKICSHVLNFFNQKQLNSAKKIAIYLPMKNEVDALLIFSSLKNDSIKFFIPNVIDNRRSLMNMIEYNFKNFDLQATMNIVNPEMLEIIFVPLVAFDKNKNRIGYGKGFYDRYLVKAKNAILIGLAYELQKVEKINNEVHDITLDYIITEKGIF